MARRRVVQRLVQAASRGMESVAGDATAFEVLSAYLSMARDGVIVAKQTGANVMLLRSAVENILLHLNDPRAHLM